MDGLAKVNRIFRIHFVPGVVGGGAARAITIGSRLLNGVTAVSVQTNPEGCVGCAAAGHAGLSPTGRDTGVVAADGRISRPVAALLRVLVEQTRYGEMLSMG